MIPRLEIEFQAPASAVENLKIPIVGSKIKVVKSIWFDLSKLLREGQKANVKRFSSIGPTSFEKNQKKTTRKYHILGKLRFWVVFGTLHLSS